MIGKQIQKPVEDWSEYTEAALWCNANKATIEDKDDCYEVVALPEQTLEEAKSEKLAELNAAFTSTSETAHCLSSAGFEINADETANRNIASLIVAMEATGAETVPFCLYDNTFQNVTLAQLKTMQLDVIAHAQALYAQKWALREAIHAAETLEELNAIGISFEPEQDITGGQSITGTSCNTDTPVAFIEQRNQSIYGEVNNEQTA
ncbi:DUF4376 domain-containing protein [Oxalobacter formigenes]